ncbi:MAG TPA: hypothetical protein VGR35_17865 [Tepidisphaeraceae bacterium]|nr:hypothetical protein [Tepidisphaeraceae bacterium]
MRSILLVFATLLLIVCGFAIYATMQAPVAERASERSTAGPTTIPLSGGGGGGEVVGPGDDPWVRRFDEKTAELESQFKAARYERQPDGSMLVDKPVAEFFLGNGRFIRIEGSHGSVILPDTKVVEGGEVRPPTAAPPSRGQLHDVVISLFDEPATGEGAAPQPTLTVAMNNTAFDNETFLITTEAFTDASGNRIEADQVPVKVRGRDYDFDGRGLRIQWNDLSRRLQLLEIAHGQSLRVKNRAKFEELQSGRSDESPEPQPSEKQSPEPSSPAAAAKRKSQHRAPAAGPTPAPTTSPIVPYRASFEKDLRITEGDAEIATGSLMQVDFVMDKGGDDAAGAAAASQDGVIAAARNSARQTHPPAAPSSTTDVAEPTPSPATSESTTSPSTAELLPIVIYWSGRLRVMPLDGSGEPPLGADDQIIRLSGTPLKLFRDGANIEAAGATFHTADGRASLRSSDEVPRVTLRDAGGAVIATPSLVYSEDGGTATLKGPSHAQIPIGSGQQQEVLSATWNEVCELALPSNPRGEAAIRHASLTGAVAISHPRIDLNSDALDLIFAAPTTQPAPEPATQSADDAPATRPASDAPNLEKLVATGSVLAKLKDRNGPPQSLHARKLEMHTTATPAGDLLPRTIIADGDVLLSEPAQSLRANRLNVTLTPKPTTAPTTAPKNAPTTTNDNENELETSPAEAPTTQRADEPPELIIESLIAQGAVRLEGENGAYATAEELQAGERNGHGEIVLAGGPSGAAVSDGRSTITGRVLKIRPDDEKAEVPGAGTLSFVSEPKDGQTPQPVHVAWRGHAALDGRTNLVDVRGGVSFTTTGTDGMTTTTHAQHLQIALVDKPPTTQPATQPTTGPGVEPTPPAMTAPASAPTNAPTTAPATRPREAGLGGIQNIDFLSNKEPRSANLTGDVRIESTLLDAEGAVERRMYLRAEEANYDLITRHMIVPVNGRLLYEDHRPPTAQEDEQESPANRGTTAFEWKRRLTYDDEAHRAVMEGDVNISHVPDAERGEPFRIATQRVTAEMEPKPTTAPTDAPATVPATNPTLPPTTAPATQPGPLPGAMRLQRVIADGGVRVETDRFAFTATRLTYSPSTGILTAHSAPGDPITLTEEGRVDSTIDSLMWNTKTDRVTLKGGRGRVRP